MADYNLALALESEHRSLDRCILLAGVRALLNHAERGVYYLAEKDGRVVGQLLLTYEWSDWRNGLFWWIQSVYVPPDCRGQHIFTSLYRHVERLARTTPGICGLRLYVDHDNRSAQRIYLALGMRHAHYEVLETDFSAASR